MSPEAGPIMRPADQLLLPFLLLAVASVAAAGGSWENGYGSILRLPSSSPRRFPRSAAVDLIHALNLHPADASPPLSTAGVEGALAPAGTLVERPIRIASFANGGAATSVEDLGHHAGYYRLPNTHDAR